MAARLERDVDGRTADIEASICCVIECLHFGMRMADRLCVTTADHLVLFYDDATNARVRRGREHAFGSQFQCQAYALYVAMNFHESLYQ